MVIFLSTDPRAPAAHRQWCRKVKQVADSMHSSFLIPTKYYIAAISDEWRRMETYCHCETLNKRLISLHPGTLCQIVNTIKLKRFKILHLCLTVIRLSMCIPSILRKHAEVIDAFLHNNQECDSSIQVPWEFTAHVRCSCHVTARLHTSIIRIYCSMSHRSRQLCWQAISQWPWAAACYLNRSLGSSLAVQVQYYGVI